MNITERTSKESFYSVSWLFIYRISGIVSSIIIANMLLEQQYGIYSVLNLWGLILNYICSMGIPIAGAKIITSNRVNNPEKNFKLFANMIFINTINLIIVCVFSILTLNFFINHVYNIQFYERKIFEILLLLTLVRATIYTLYSLQQGIATGYREFKIISIIFILGYTLKIPILLFFSLGFQLVGVFIAEILMELIIFVTFFIFLKKYFQKNDLKIECKIQKKYLKDLYGLGIPASLSLLIFLIVNWFGLTILSTFHTFADVGTFQTSLNIVNLVMVVPYGIISTFLPEITEKFETDPEEFYKTISKLLKLISLIVIPLIVFVGLFSPFLIQIFYPKYYNLITFYSAYILLSYLFINSFTLVYFYSFVSMGKSRVLILLESCKALSFFILLIFLVPTYGIIGLAYVFFISFLIYAVIYQIISLHYNFKPNLRNYVFLFALFFGFLFYSFIFPIINLVSPIWIFSAVFITTFISIVCIFQLWKDADCKNFIISILNIFKRSSISEKNV
ncbi:MAG: oligosaccharide flippase family protein [Candidatus Helarchaeota archaeon]